MNRYMGTANGNRNRKDPGRIQEPFHYGSRILNGSRNRLKRIRIRIRIPSVETDPDTHPTNGSGFNGYGSLKGSCSTIIANSENLKVFFKWFFILNVICFLWKRIPYGSKLRIADPKRIQEPFETDPDSARLRIPVFWVTQPAQNSQKTVFLGVWETIELSRYPISRPHTPNYQFWSSIV